MPLDVHAEVVVAKRLSGGTGLDSSHVHPAHRELGEDCQQGAGLILVDGEGERGLVGSRRRWHRAGALDQHEAGVSVLGIADIAGKNVQTVDLRSDRRRNSRVVEPRQIIEPSGSARGGECRQHDNARQVDVQPAAHLCMGMWMRGNPMDVGQASSRRRNQIHGDRQDDFVNDDQVGAGRRELVKCQRHRTLDFAIEVDICFVEKIEAIQIFINISN